MTRGGRTESGRTLVLGIGNILWADEAFGVRAVEALHRRYALPEGVDIMDGGTQGLYLVQDVRAAGSLLVLDAVDFGREPGEVVIVRGADVPRFTGAKAMSLHQTGFQDVLSAADLLGGGPTRLTLIGVQAADLSTWGGPLSAPVRDRLDDVVERAVTELKAWGIAVEARDPPLADTGSGLLRHGLDIAGFEGHRGMGS
ncbi:HyaD/HybD family hydrogenase maturation endopeptidase [Roseospira marina]|uniref:Hydrogenase expression/formation protein HupD n=1 Tax=Roseospira marina TaxID=140057 RepID=A0A5M6IFC5_9PROT|nr:HyaD/HybD family hydrogenase maturation endopeptidase [Roseospira marina]KAA5606278.1 HyaD/HybD family hydrogenase maturation endopeptidase [Roseospira marina]MBB4314436.1 hydrogenase maturation protease [Roseospira marina]MBB5087596.1 hydrogenase maturation protease [Roseospira marina]